jgi:hypothetical protein
MASPPTAIVPLPVVIAERRILVASESGTVEIIVNPCSASAIIGEVRCAVDRDVSIPIDRHVVATTKLIRVANAIHLDVPGPVHRYVSFAINVEISRPINRSIVSRAKLLIPVSFANRVHPRVLIHRHV